MSYMGAYVLWLEDNGLEGMEHVERYHKENPHMIPKPREPQGNITNLPSFFTLGKEEDG